jgi:hypothetical protein
MGNAVVISAALFWLVSSTNAWAQNAAVAIGTKQRMDIAVTRSVVDVNGERIGPPAQIIRYQMIRVKTDGGWHTTMTLGAPDGASRDQRAKNPFFGGRVEFDHDGGFAMFDNTGREVPVPAGMAAVVPRLGGGDWTESLQVVSTAANSRKARREEVEAKYGRPAGKVRGHTQYLRRTGEDVEELLYDAALGIPVELNVMRGDVLKARIAFDYVEQHGRGLVRRGIRSEAVLNDDGDRAVTTTAFANVVVEREK